MKEGRERKKENEKGGRDWEREKESGFPVRGFNMINMNLSLEKS